MGVGGNIREPMWYNRSTLAWNTRDMGSSPALDTVLPIFVTPVTLVGVTMMLYKLHAVWLLNHVYPVYICKATACMYVCNCKH